MKIWIPTCGDAVKLLEPWRVKLSFERRNLKTLAAVGADTSLAKKTNASIELAAGDELVFDRLYVRQGKDDMASVTFIVKRAAEVSLIGCRFWVKIADANLINAELVSRENPVGGFAPGQYIAALHSEAEPALASMRAAAKKRHNEIDAVKDACAGACHDPLTQRHCREMASQLLKRLQDAEIKRNQASTNYRTTWWQSFSVENFLHTVSMRRKKRDALSNHWHVRSTEKIDDATRRTVVMCQFDNDNTLLKSSAALIVDTDADGAVDQIVCSKSDNVISSD